MRKNLKTFHQISMVFLFVIFVFESKNTRVVVNTIVHM